MKKKTRWPLALDDAKAILRSVDLRCTAARIAVLQCLQASSCPMTPADIADTLADYGFDKSTIYRSLTELHDSGKVTRLDLGDSVRRFELLTEAGDGTSEHPHFMCVDCGEVVCMADFTVELRPSSTGSRPPGIVSEVLVRGHCDSCCS
ncbi:MAG: transcriptional repressor [Fuerstiella sp.]